VENDYVTASTRSAEQPPSTSGFVLQLVDSAPNSVFRPACDDIDGPTEESLEYVKNGKKLLHCAGTGDALGLYAILMKKSRVDINYLGVPDDYPGPFSEIQYSGTALMVAAKAGHYNVMYALLKASALRPKHRLDLSIRPPEGDYFGQTAMSLVAHQQSGMIRSFAPCKKDYLPFRRFLRSLVAILCCGCSKQPYTGNGYDMTGLRGKDLRHVLGLDPCKWCRRLWVRDWPGVNDVEKINECVQEGRASITDAKRALLMTKDWVELKDD
jgi:hypothetical protein